jgi:ubiquinone/menaquinone biosynthesis C-methylase UbiE
MSSNSDGLTQNWNDSYSRCENFVFWPSDGSIRFISRYIRRRVGLEAVQDMAPGAKGAKVLDLGCGIGRHIQFGLQMGLDIHGIELSDVAVEVARAWSKVGMQGDEFDKIRVGDVRHLPWSDCYFDHALSDSVLDSMSFEIACKGVSEIARVLKPGGYFYCNLIADKDPATGVYFSGERTVTMVHEQGTIQSYFDRAKIDVMCAGAFEILSCEMHAIENALSGSWAGRWHLVLRRR